MITDRASCWTKYCVRNIMNNLLVGVALFLAETDRQTDRHDKANCLLIATGLRTRLKMNSVESGTLMI